MFGAQRKTNGEVFKMLIRSRAPVRVDFAGGWTDVALFARETPGFVINAALNVYSYATIRTSAVKAGTSQLQHETDLTDQSVSIYSSDFDVFVEAKDIRKLEYDGNVDLVKAAIRRMEVPGGFDMITQSVAPPGSGLGTSASMGVSLLGALAKYAGKHLLQYELAELASTIEREELGILGGKQDHYASALGGISFMEFRGEDVKASRLILQRDTYLELEKNLVLCYTGKSRLSGDIHKNVTDAYKAKDPNTVDAIETMKRLTIEMKNALMSGDLDVFGKLMSENWRNQKRLHASVTNPDIDRLFDLAMTNGAVGGKACGAGGGGCILFYCQPDSAHRVRRVLEEARVQVIDFNLDDGGLQTWISR